MFSQADILVEDLFTALGANRRSEAPPLRLSAFVDDNECNLISLPLTAVPRDSLNLPLMIFVNPVLPSPVFTASIEQ